MEWYQSCEQPQQQQLPSVHVANVAVTGADERWCPVRCEEEGAKVQKIPGFPAYVVHLDADTPSSADNAQLDQQTNMQDCSQTTPQQQFQQSPTASNSSNASAASDSSTPSRRKYLSVQDLL